MGATNQEISKLESILTNIPLQPGYSPECWKNCMDVMILKHSGCMQLSALCTYWSGDDVFMEKNKSLASEQYDSRRRYCAINLAVNKSLTNDILRQLKHPEATCYGLIGHTQASIAMQCRGVSRSAIDCLFTTLHKATH